MTTIEEIAKLQKRLSRLQEDYGQHNTAPVDIQRLLEIARVTVEWQDPFIWDNHTFGDACMIPKRSGFIVRIPGDSKDYHSQWKRFVLGHEIGHTLFYDPIDLGGDSRVNLRKDIWMSRETEEKLCDKISEVLLMSQKYSLSKPFFF